MNATRYITVLIGSAGVGKSCIKIQYKCGHFPEDPRQYEEICDVGFQKQIRCDEEICFVDILDLNGQEDYVQQFLPKAEGFMLAYSTKCPMVLVGNKCDLDPVRQVTTAEGQQLAKQYGIPFFEVNAYDGLRVEESFRALIREIRRVKKEQKVE